MDPRKKRQTQQGTGIRTPLVVPPIVHDRPAVEEPAPRRSARTGPGPLTALQRAAQLREERDQTLQMRPEEEIKKIRARRRQASERPEEAKVEVQENWERMSLQYALVQPMNSVFVEGRYLTRSEGAATDELFDVDADEHLTELDEVQFDEGQGRILLRAIGTDLSPDMMNCILAIQQSMLHCYQSTRSAHHLNFDQVHHEVRAALSAAGRAIATFWTEEFANRRTQYNAVYLRFADEIDFYEEVMPHKN